MSLFRTSINVTRFVIQTQTRRARNIYALLQPIKKGIEYGRYSKKSLCSAALAAIFLSISSPSFSQSQSNSAAEPSATNNILSTTASNQVQQAGPGRGFGRRAQKPSEIRRLQSSTNTTIRAMRRGRDANALSPDSFLELPPVEGGQPVLTQDQQFEKARHGLATNFLTKADRRITDARVIDAMKQIPRHNFVPTEELDQAYDDQPLDIGYSRSIQQPYTIALGLQQLNSKPNDRVLEVGTGSGYQAAVLSRLVKEVYTLESLEILTKRATVDIQRAGCTNVFVRTGDGTAGWPEAAPFDAIIINGNETQFSQSLVSQLKEGGRLIVPSVEEQKLHSYQKTGGQIVKIADVPMLAKAFVPKHHPKAQK